MRQRMVMRRKSQSYKLKLEKRRRTRRAQRNQRGGGEIAVDITDWVKKVIEKFTEERAGKTTLGIFANQELTVPDQPELLIGVHQPVTLQTAGQKILDIISQRKAEQTEQVQGPISDMTFGEFNMLMEPNALTDGKKDVQKDYMLSIENSLRGATKWDSEKYSKLANTNELISANKQPLFIWALIVNLTQSAQSKQAPAALDVSEEDGVV